MQGLYSRLPLETANKENVDMHWKQNDHSRSKGKSSSSRVDAYLEETDERVAQPVIQPLYGSDQYVAQRR